MSYFTIPCQNTRLTKQQADELSKELLAHAHQISQPDGHNAERTDPNDDDTYKIPDHERQKKLVQVMKLLDTQ